MRLAPASGAMVALDESHGGHRTPFEAFHHALSRGQGSCLGLGLLFEDALGVCSGGVEGLVAFVEEIREACL